METIIQNFKNQKIFVIGDLILDHFIWGQVSRISPEAPVPVVNVTQDELMPGGAANVARNLVSLGAQSTICGLVGEDEYAKQLENILTEEGARPLLIPESGRQTSQKMRIVAHQQQVVRVDRESPHPIAGASIEILKQTLEKELPHCDAVIIGDYAKGMLTDESLQAILEPCIQQGKWLSYDPKPANRLNFKGVSLATPNRKEIFETAGIADQSYHSDPTQDKCLSEAISKVLEQYQPQMLLVTLGELGMMLCSNDFKPIHVPTYAQKVFDVSGAGDTVIATFTLATAAGATPEEAAILANHAAGVVVAKPGTATANEEEILQHLKQFMA